MTAAATPPERSRSNAKEKAADEGGLFYFASDGD
jgi:hypothetical protein